MTRIPLHSQLRFVYCCCLLRRSWQHDKNSTLLVKLRTSLKVTQRLLKTNKKTQLRHCVITKPFAMKRALYIYAGTICNVVIPITHSPAFRQRRPPQNNLPQCIGAQNYNKHFHTVSLTDISHQKRPSGAPAHTTQCLCSSRDLPETKSINGNPPVNNKSLVSH